MMMDSAAPSKASPSMYPSAAMSSAPSSNTQYVVVGGTAGLVYTPEYVCANIGDVVVFHYGVKNHTLTQSSFAEPCSAMGGGAISVDIFLTVGQNSGFMPTDGSTLPQFSVIVTTTSPQCTTPFDIVDDRVLLSTGQSLPAGNGVCY
jgi:plastocyanin